MKSEFELKDIRNNSIWNLYRMRDKIEMNPTYQREGGVWTKDKQRLLVDTVLNGFDIPKLYLHQFVTPQDSGNASFEYAVIDGKQRLEAIWDFLEGKLAVGPTTEYIRDPSINLTGMLYNQIAKKYPDIRADFDAFKLDVVVIETDDIELIEDMFSRLNESVPLNAAEKRNALPGPLPGAVRKLTKTKFFLEKLPFSNRRYRHYDLASKMLYFAARNGVADTKKAYIDKFFKDYASKNNSDISPRLDLAKKTVSEMEQVFENGDQLLKSIGMITIYYALFMRAQERNLLGLLSREKFVEFELERLANRARAQDDIADADYLLLEFDRFTQSPNDGFANRFRLAVMDAQLFDEKLGFASELPNRSA